MVLVSQLVVAYLVLIQVFKVSQSQRNTVEGINARHYHTLCDIYNVAATPPKKLYDPTEVEKIQEKINVINASLADEVWFNEISKTSEKEKLSDAFKGRNGDYKNLFESWKKAVSMVAENSEGVKKLTPTKTAVKIAQLKIKNIETQFEKIFKNLKELNASARLDEIKKKFDAAIGEEGCAQDPKTCGVVGNRNAATCGTTAGARGSGSPSGTKSGTNLIVDFFCLCAMHTSGGGPELANGKECIDTTGATTAVLWQNGAAISNGAKELWGALKAGCEKQRFAKVASARAGAQAISAFLAEVGTVDSTEATNQAGKQFGIGMLGVCAVAGSGGKCAGNCDGDMSGSDDGGICVSYGTKPADWDKIEWLTSLKAGLNLLAQYEETYATIQADIINLKMLQRRAEEIYDEAQIASELEKHDYINPTQNHSQGQNPITKSGAATLHEPGSVNLATIPRFILPWIFLI